METEKKISLAAGALMLLACLLPWKGGIVLSPSIVDIINFKFDTLTTLFPVLAIAGIVAAYMNKPLLAGISYGGVLAMIIWITLKMMPFGDMSAFISVFKTLRMGFYLMAISSLVGVSLVGVLFSKELKELIKPIIKNIELVLAILVLSFISIGGLYYISQFRFNIKSMPDIIEFAALLLLIVGIAGITFFSRKYLIMSRDVETNKKTSSAAGALMLLAWVLPICIVVSISNSSGDTPCECAALMKKHGLITYSDVQNIKLITGGKGKVYEEWKRAEKCLSKYDYEDYKGCN